MTATRASANVAENARATHERALVIDCLDDSLPDDRHWDQLQRGGVTAVNVTVTAADGFEATCKLIAEYNLRIERHEKLTGPIRTADDITRAKANGKIGIIYGFQNATPIEGDPRLIRLFWDMGVRVIQLVWDSANLVGDSAYESRNAGLTKFGAAVVKELHKCRILIDLSHCDHRTTMDAIDLSDRPVAFTHANVRKLSNIVRNKEDDLIKALAARGGVMGIVSLASFVADDWHEASLSRYCDHIDYVANLVGIEHVGIGSDFTENLPASVLAPANWGGAEISDDEVYKDAEKGFFPYPYARDLEDASKFGNVTSELLKRGYSAADVTKVLGGNWLRLFRSVWAP